LIEFTKYLKRIENEYIIPDYETYSDYSENLGLNEFNEFISYIENLNIVTHKSFEFISGKSSGNSFNFLQLNYTKFFDNIIDLYKNSLPRAKIKIDNKPADLSVLVLFNLHLHGSLSTNCIIGLDNIKQLANIDFHGHQDTGRFLTKQGFINTLSEHNVNNELLGNIEIAKTIIKDSNVIIAFGTSIGETDKRWWKLIGEWLTKSPDNKFVIIAYSNNELKTSELPFTRIREIDRYEQKRKDETESIKNKFYKLAEWADDDIKTFGESLLIEFNTDIFDYDISPFKVKEIIYDD
jgi:hypothetical protein